MKEIDIFKITYVDINVKSNNASMIRGYFANKYKDIDKMHNHKDNSYIYRYPEIQYKIITNNPVLIGINEGAKIIKKELIYLDNVIKIGEEEIISNQRKIESNKYNIGECDEIINYEFITPWLALNQTNTIKYKQLDIIDKETLLKKILIGNVISLSKGIGYTIDKELKVKLNLKEMKVKFKGNNMIAFTGSFYINFNIPDDLGLGKSISRGFGTIKKVHKNKD